MRVRDRKLVWLFWLSALIALAALLIALRGRLDNAHIVLVLLLLVLTGSATGGRALGLTLVALSFLIFNFFFLPPFYTLAVADPWDWLVLAAFLATSVVATQLLDRAQERAETARQRAEEVQRLAYAPARRRATRCWWSSAVASRSPPMALTSSCDVATALLEAQHATVAIRTDGIAVLLPCERI